MDSENSDLNSTDLDPTERAALNALPRELPPPAGMEERLVQELSARGMLRAGAPANLPRRRSVRVLAALAAAAALFTAGLWAGRSMRSASVASPTGPRYMLLLHEGEGFRGATDPADARRRVEEYTRWAVDLHRAGRLVTGEELASGGWLLSLGGSAPIPSGGDRIGGYFVIVADSDQRAREIASTCPGLRYGSRIELRPIQET